MLLPYRQLLSNLPQTFAESSQKYHLFTERHLQALWFDQKYFKGLTTSEGVPIEVISPGIWNAEAGPDFRKAHIKIGLKVLKGDIELHLSEDDWYNHQHHEDGRYNQVVLHVALWKPKQDKNIVTKRGSVVTPCFLEDNLTIPLAKIVQFIDLDLYPYRKFHGSGQCAQTLYRDLSTESIEKLFKSAAEWRLRKKKEFLELRFSEKYLQFAASIAMALGYKNNAEAFLDLFMKLISLPQWNEEAVLAVSMGMCGFFDSDSEKKWKGSQKFRELKECWHKLPYQVSLVIKLALNQIRPHNHPVRRLVYLSKLLTDPHFSSLYDTMAAHWIKSFSQFKPSELRQELCSLIPSYTDHYWNSHYLFEENGKQEFLTLLGEDLKEKILINGFFPILYADILKRNDEEEMAAFIHFYSSFSSEKSGKSKYLVHRFFGDHVKGKILNKAIFEQGAYQLHRDFCLHYEASCEGCPFVERFQLLNTDERR